MLSSAPAYCLLFPLSLSLSLSCALILEVQQPCEICLVICVAKMVCALKNGACHKWHSCGSKPNAENKQLLLNICTHTPLTYPLSLTSPTSCLGAWPTRAAKSLRAQIEHTNGPHNGLHWSKWHAETGPH